MIQQDIYKIPITKMDLEGGVVCMNHLSQIIKNKALPKCSSKLVLSGGFDKSAHLFTWSSGELCIKRLSKSSPVLCRSLQPCPTPWEEVRKKGREERREEERSQSNKEQERYNDR